jgi:xanthine dehydrogenase accessory factor
LAFFNRAMVLVRGGGDLASGAIYRLHRAGFPVIVTELPTPILVRRTVSFGEAVYNGAMTVEGVTARLVDRIEAVPDVLAANEIVVVVDTDGMAIVRLKPIVVVDARMEKVNRGTTINDAPLVVALGPGYTAGLDCHAIIETNRGHHLGRVIETGSAEPDTGEPGAVQGQTHSRVLRSPTNGHVHGLVMIGDSVQTGDVIAAVGDQPIVAAFSGVLRGLINERVAVKAGMKVGDLDPRAKREHCFSISDKSLAVGGGVLEAVMSAPQVRPYLQAAYEAQSGV